MRSDPGVQRRRSTRLARYDYATVAAYFVTLCTWNRTCLFGDVVEGIMQLSTAGMVAERLWRTVPDHFSSVMLDAFVVMPNHVHGILMLGESKSEERQEDRATHADGAVQDRARQEDRLLRENRATHASPLREGAGGRPRGPARRSLGAIVGSYKAATSRLIHAAAGSPGMPLWQRNYHDHIIRDEADLERVRRYIEANPARWAEDDENPARLRHA